MRVFGLTTGADTAGINVAITHAFRRHAPEWTLNSMVASTNYIGYPVDVPWSRIALERLWDAADVHHIHSTIHAHRWYGGVTPTVLHHHGMHTMEDFQRNVTDGAEIGAVQVGSTLDLTVHAPQLEWLPAPVNLEAMRAIRGKAIRRSRKLRIGHAPTNRGIKGTEAFIAAMRRLANEGHDVQAVLIEGKPWRECLEMKATCDVFFDQPTLGYGSNAVEAWAMGIPVLCGVADPTVRAAMLDRWDGLPFFEANERTLYETLLALVTDQSLRRHYAERGTRHVERWHDERHTVEHLKRLYRSAKRTTPGGRMKRLTNREVLRIVRHEQRTRRKQQGVTA